MSDTAPEPILISALQHHAFCLRQCALIHIERIWDENTLTAEGRVLHERAHAGGGETRPGIRIARSLPLQSLRHGLQGIADIVEFHRDPAAPPEAPPRPFPVEYKRGHPKPNNIDAVQLCAQALCLEEMLHVEIPAGALYYGETRRRQDIAFTPQLRAETLVRAQAVRALLATARTPPPAYGKHCRSCSLLDHCRPRATTRADSASTYLTRLMTAPD